MQPDDDTYYADAYPDAAPIDFQRRQARAYLERLVGHQLIPIDAHDEDGPCDDCKTVRRRYRFGQLTVCLLCACRRRGADATREAA
jgi:hypothetical protein